MRIIDQYHVIQSVPENLLEQIELAARTCYKSEHKITADSAEKFVKMLIDRGHHAMIEFGDIIVKFVTNRGVSHELVRHRHCSYAQESTRYVNYGGDDIVFIRPVWAPDPDNADLFDPIFYWQDAMEEAERYYKVLIDQGWAAQQAREVLPHSLKTEIVAKANIREWRHIFNLRCSKKAHPQMRALMLPTLAAFKELCPVVFDDIEFA